MSSEAPKLWLNALIGAVITIAFSFTIISPVLGGLVTGYLNRSDGVRAGALAGAIAAIPLLVILLISLGVFMIVAVPVVLGIFFVFFAAILIPAYIIALSALGGYLGVYLHDEL